VVVEHSERTVPVYAGCPGPLLVELHTALYLHGSEGLGDIGSPKARLQPEREHTVDYLMHVLPELSNTPCCWMADRLPRRALERWKGPVSRPDASVGVALAPDIAWAQMYSVVVERIDSARYLRLITDTLIGGEHTVDTHPKESKK
jgi:hypothetical protein